MAKSQRGYILATCFFSAAAAILSIVTLAIQEWVVSKVRSPETSLSVTEDSVRFGLFGGIFKQVSTQTTFELTTVCAFNLNICALLCGDNMKDNLQNLYEHKAIPAIDMASCPRIDNEQYWNERNFTRTTHEGERIFINAGIWLCTILFLIISIIMGLFSAGLAVVNTISSPTQAYFRIFGLYIYNATAFFSVMLSVILWGIMFTRDLILNVPTYKTFLEEFTTKNYAQLGYTYWINLASLVFYMVSLYLLYTRNCVLSNRREVNEESISENRRHTNNSKIKNSSSRRTPDQERSLI